MNKTCLIVLFTYKEKSKATLNKNPVCPFLSEKYHILSFHAKFSIYKAAVAVSLVLKDRREILSSCSSIHLLRASHLFRK